MTYAKHLYRKENKERQHFRHRRRSVPIKLIIICSILILIATFGLVALRQAKALRAKASDLKKDVKEVAVCLKSGDCESAVSAADKLDADAAYINGALKRPMWRIAAVVPAFSQEIDSVKILLSCLDTASVKLIRPAIALIDKYPVQSIVKLNKGSGDAVDEYLSFAKTSIPTVVSMADNMRSVKLKYADRDGKLTGYISEFIFYSEILDEAEERVLSPIFELTDDIPVSSLKTSDGINVNGVMRYVNLFCRLFPELKEIISEVDDEVLNSIDKNGNLKVLSEQLQILTEFASTTISEYAEPTLQLLDEYPISSLSSKGGLNTKLIPVYLDFAENTVPGLRASLVELTSSHPGLFDPDASGPAARVSGYIAKLNTLFGLYDEAEAYFPLIRSILGDGDDRCFLLMAQNSAEIRACGGFPGSIGMLQIKNGKLKIGDFKSVYKLMSVQIPVEHDGTKEEFKLFGEELQRAWDAGMNPNYPRVGEMLTSACEDKLKIEIDGAISLSPTVIQDILEVCGPVKLSNGTVLNGKNATKYIQYDVYTDIYVRGQEKDDTIADTVFAETADAVFSSVIDTLSGSRSKSGLSDNLKKLVGLFQIVQKRTASREIMLWFKDTDDERLCIAAGCSGCLPIDERNPQTGIWFSGITPSKLGWYLDIDYAISDPFITDSGETACNITAVITNTVTKEDVKTYSDYIVGHSQGWYASRIQVSAPAGGSIKNFKTSTRVEQTSLNYCGLDFISFSYTLKPQESLVISYTVTASPNALYPISVVSTPTLQQYR